MNKFIGKGRLTATPELKKTQTDKDFTFFSVAINRRFNKEETDFINCCAFGKTAEFIVKYFSKGQEMLFTGELHLDKYVKDDETRITPKIVIDEVEFCGSKKDNETAKASEAPSLDDFVEVDDLDDLPF